jgi:hypothetical protein
LNDHECQGNICEQLIVVADQNDAEQNISKVKLMKDKVVNFISKVDPLASREAI